MRPPGGGSGTRHGIHPRRDPAAAQPRLPARRTDRIVGSLAHTPLNLCVHTIFGFPWETRDMMLAQPARSTASRRSVSSNSTTCTSSKARSSPPAIRRNRSRLFGLAGYTDFLCEFLPLLRPDIVIQRLFGIADQACSSPRTGTSRNPRSKPISTGKSNAAASSRAAGLIDHQHRRILHRRERCRATRQQRERAFPETPPPSTPQVPRHHGNDRKPLCRHTVQHLPGGEGFPARHEIRGMARVSPSSASIRGSKMIEIDAGERLRDMKLARFSIEPSAIPIEHAEGGIRLCRIS